jgi:serine/threonine-protein kinase ULK/ATG1
MSGMAPVAGDTVQGWSMERVVGSGSFATVWLARRGPETAAIKVIATERLSSKLKQSLESEVTILRKIDHPNIVRLLETVKVRPGSALLDGVEMSDTADRTSDTVHAWIS